MKIRHFFEYAALRCVCAVLGWVPYRVALVFAWGLAWFAHRVLQYRVKTAHTRIRTVFGSKLSDAEIRNIAWLAWRNFVFNLLDLARLAKTPVEHLNKRVRGTANISFLEDRAQHQQGGVIVSIHMGAWEMMPKLGYKHGMRLFSIGRPQRNPFVNHYLERLRTGLGFDTLMRGSAAVKGILSRIKKGEFFAVLMDVRHPDMQVDFLGGRANVSESAAVFARHCKVPLVPFAIHRTSWTDHEYRLFDPIWPDLNADKEADLMRVTQEIFAVFDRCIRERPDHYFWFNKRWILDPYKNEATVTSAG